MSLTVEALKEQVRQAVDRRASTLLDVSHDIHGHPELAFDEHRAHELLTSVLEGEGLAVQRGLLDVPTAFAATARRGDGPLVAVLLEYDALPEIGHACGHNVIAAAGLGAGLAAASVVDALGGRLLVLGTPAEEGGGGKILLAERGAFEGVSAAVMVHPADHDLTHMSAVAYQQLTIDYHGEAAHAAAAPWKGRNALDAAVAGYTNVAALRQHIEPGERIHGIFTQGGDKPNIVPHRASTFWYVRSPTARALQPLKARVLAALEAGAAATGCTCDHRWGARPYREVLDNGPLVEAFAANLRSTGRELRAPDDVAVVGSTDLGNVSFLVPSMHPMVKAAPAGVPIHSEPFAAYAGGEEGDRAVLDAAVALAATIVDVWADEGLRTRSRAAWEVAVAASAPLST